MPRPKNSIVGSLADRQMDAFFAEHKRKIEASVQLCERLPDATTQYRIEKSKKNSTPLLGIVRKAFRSVVDFLKSFGEPS